MRRQRVLAVASILVLFAVGLPARQTAPASQAQRPAVFRTDTNFVQVDAYPMKDGRILTNLEASDFEILEDGKPQKVEAFEFVKMEPFTPDEQKRDPNTVRESIEAAADPKNRVFVIYLDTPHVTIAAAHEARKPLIQALNRVMAPGDLFGVMTPAMRPSDITFGRQLTTTEDMMTRYWPWGQRDSILRSPQEEALVPCTIDPETGKDMGVDDDGISAKMIDALVDRKREDEMLTHLENTIDYLGMIRETRKSLVIFTGGWRMFGPNQGIAGPLTKLLQYYKPVPPMGMAGPGRLRQPGEGGMAGCVSEVQRIAAIDNRSRLNSIIQRANRNNVVFYPINPMGLEVFDIPINRPSATENIKLQMTRVTERTDHLMEAASNTGGIAVVNTNNMQAGLERIANQLSAYYVLGYTSTNTKHDGQFRKIDVRLKVPGATVTARRGYRAPTEAEMAARNAAAPAVSAAESAKADELAAALGTLSRIRTGADLYGVGVQTATSELTVFAEVASTLASQGKWMEGGELQVVVTTPAGEQVATGRGRLDAISRGASARIALPPGAEGPWNAQVRVRNGGELIETSIAIPKASLPSATTLLSAPLVYRAGPGMTSALHPAADFQFRRTERAHFEWLTGAPLDTREARLLDRAGNALPVQVTLAEKAGALVADVNLAPLGAGDYIIDLTVTSGLVTAKTKIAIRIGN